MSGSSSAAVFDGVTSIGVLTASGIGDFLMTVPALTALRAAYPEARIVVLGDTWHPGLLSGRPGPWDGALAVPRDDGVCRLDDDPRAAIHRFVTAQAGRHDLLVQLHGGGADSNAVVRSLRPRFSIGSWTPGAEPLDRSVPYVEHRPEVLRWLEVVELGGAKPSAGTTSLVPSISVTQADLEESRRAWNRPHPFVVVHVGARDGRRRWSPTKFAEVGRALRAALSAEIVLVGAHADRAASREVATRIGPGAVDLTGRLSLGATLGLARRSRLFLGNDSGPRHLAAAAGTPTVGVFWIGNLLPFGPLVGPANRASVSFTVECPVCRLEQLRHRCEHDVSFVDSVDVDEVLHHCLEATRCDERPAPGRGDVQTRESPRIAG